MNIKKIIKQKNNKYKIFFDDTFICTYDNVIIENNLLYKKIIDKQLYNKIILDTNYYDIYNKVVKYIMKKRKSEYEVRLYINKYITDEKIINDIIIKLKNINLINDIEYCKAFINDEIYLSKNGINIIKKKLLDNKIPLNIINEELDKIDSDIINETLEKIILKKMKNNKKYSNYELKNKILNEMINKGYNKDDILNIINNNIKDDNNILANEYNKLYNKLKLKYVESELKIKLKQKLMSKGFNLDEINKIINKKED